MKHSRLFLMLVVSLLAACESSLDRRYLDTTLGQPLEIPPDLATFDNASNFDLPDSIQASNSEEPGKVPVLAKVDSMHLQGQGDLYWLDVNEPVSSLYQKVKNFWGFEGYALVMDEPVIGVMQTEWVYTEEGASNKDSNWLESFFQGGDLSATQDQFRTRLERRDSDRGSRIYIAHRGTEYIHEVRLGDKRSEGTVNEWGYRPNEPELEVEMLSRLMIYLGMQEEAVDDQVARVQLFKPRAIMDVDAEVKSPYLILLDPYHIAWNRVNQTLQRLNFEIEVSEFRTGFIDEGVFIVKSNVVEVVEDHGFFSSSSEKRIRRKYTLILTEEDHESTRVILEAELGDYDTSPEAAEFLKVLYEQLR